jgi:formylglycine-generating enzyme required for sulfatase activity
VARGGSWNIFADRCTSSCRTFDYPSSVIYSHGFRLCMNPEAPLGVGTRGSDTSVASGRASSNALYCVIDLSAGPKASKYPVSYLAAEPKGGFNTDEYKTTKLVLRRIEPGKFLVDGKLGVTLTKSFYCGIFEVTQKQYELVTGGNPSERKGDTRPVEQVSWNMVRGDSSTCDWPSSVKVDPNSFMGKIQARTGLNFDLPTEAQWEYACRAGTTSRYNNGGDSEADLK